MNELNNIQRQFGDYLFNFINSKVASIDDAKDIYQEVLIKIITKSDQLSNNESLKSWLFMIARNQIIDFYRSQKKQVNINQITMQSNFDEEHHSVYNQLEGCMIEFVNQLPKEYKLLIMESEIKGKSQKDLAETLNMNYATVRSKVQRGRNKLKDMILNACLIERDSIGRIMECKPQNKPSTNSSNKSGK